MSCANLIALCALTRQPCQHAQYDGKCNRAACSSQTVPTFREMVEIYRAASSPSVRHAQGIESYMRRIPEIIGLNYESKVMLGANEWELIYARLKDGTHPYAHEGGYSPHSIKTMFMAFQTCCGKSNKKIRAEYKRRGLSAPDTDMIPDIDYSLASKEIEELSEEQVMIVTDRMTELRKSTKPADESRFIWMYFYFYFGVRPSDICRLTWDCIKADQLGGNRFEYVPHKTDRKTCGRPAGSSIHPRLMLMIKPFIGEANAYVIPRHENRRQKTVTRITNGESVGYHASIRKWLNKFMRVEVGVKGTKASYLLRRNCAKWTLEHKGAMAECQLLGHTPKVMSENYVNIHKISMRDNLK